MPENAHPHPWEKLEPILDHALDLEGEARNRYVREACGDDDTLRAEVESLLAASEASGPLDRPLEEIAADVAREASDGAGVAGPEVGRRIGAWRILAVLGAGGMGRVFRAERVDGGFQQECALKLLRWEMATEPLIERFRQERQILAGLQHPGIARLIDGGLTEEGLPYLAMELVEGEPITEHARQRELPVEQRLELFLQVVDAVDEAHRNLVVHRDLKPSNILVTPEAQVRLLDFGIAKILDQTDLDATQTRQAMATPVSAAPEQLAGGPITTATDVWALGVLLYELLADRRPFGAEGDDPSAITRSVLEADPRPPSEGGPESHRRRLRGDLDTIVLAALRKEPTRRYPSAERLGEDVRRHLAGLPVLARPATWQYRARKFVRRHRVPVFLTAASLALVIGLVSFYTLRLANERDRVVREARRTEEVKSFVLSLFEVEDPSLVSGLEVTARELLDRGAERAEEELVGEPEIQAEVHHVIAGLFDELGLYEEAATAYARAVELRRASLGPDHPLVGDSLNRLGYVLQSLDRAEEAESVLREALALWDRNPEEEERRSTALNHLGLILAYRGEYDEAEAFLRESLQIKRRVLGDEHPQTATTLSNLGLTVKWKGDFDAAEPLYREALAIRRKILGDFSADVANTLDNLGVMLGQRGDYEESERCFREALEIRTQLLGEEHPDVALNLNNLATLFRVQGRLDEAAPIYEQVLEMNIRMFGPDHRRVATNLNNLGSIALQQGQYERAEELAGRVLDIRRRKLGDQHVDVAQALDQLVVTRIRQGRFQDADEPSSEAVAVANQSVDSESPRRAPILRHRAEVLLGLGRPEEARPLLEDALSVQEAALAPDHWETAVTRGLLGRTLERLGAVDEAESLLLRAYEDLVASRGEGDPETDRVREALVQFYRRTGDQDQVQRFTGSADEGD